VRPANDRPRVEGLLDTTVSLDGAALFGVPAGASDFLWEQVFADQDSLDYTTQNVAEVSDPDSLVAAFMPGEPGVYRFRLSAKSAEGDSIEYEAEVAVRPQSAAQFDFRAIGFPDLFGDNGGPEFDIDPDSPECRRKALEHAFAVTKRTNANWVSVSPANFLTQLDPTPVWGAQYENLSLTSDDFYAAFIDTAHANGLKVLQTEQDAPDGSIKPDEYARWNDVRQTPGYWEEWFNQWQVWAVARAARAEAFGVDMFVPFVWADDTFKPQVYPDYDRRWREMIAAIREVYSGEVGVAVLSIGVADLTFADAVDAVFVAIDGSGIAYREVVADRDNPTMEQIREIADEKVAIARERLADSGVPVYFMLSATSSSGQRGSEDVNELATFVPDFQEQALYFETMLQSIQDEPWVKGALAGVVDWFDQFARSPEQIYFDQTFQASPRSKPAEDVFRLWFSQ
jgi:hypothetical protein